MFLARLVYTRKSAGAAVLTMIDHSMLFSGIPNMADRPIHWRLFFCLQLLNERSAASNGDVGGQRGDLHKPILWLFRTNVCELLHILNVHVWPFVSFCISASVYESLSSLPSASIIIHDLDSSYQAPSHCCSVSGNSSELFIEQVLLLTDRFYQSQQITGTVRNRGIDHSNPHTTSISHSFLWLRLTTCLFSYLLVDKSIEHIFSNVPSFVKTTIKSSL